MSKKQNTGGRQAVKAPARPTAPAPASVAPSVESETAPATEAGVDGTAASPFVEEPEGSTQESEPETDANDTQDGEEAAEGEDGSQEPEESEEEPQEPDTEDTEDMAGATKPPVETDEAEEPTAEQRMAAMQEEIDRLRAEAAERAVVPTGATLGPESGVAQPVTTVPQGTGGAVQTDAGTGEEVVTVNCGNEIYTYQGTRLGPGEVKIKTKPKDPEHYGTRMAASLRRSVEAFTAAEAARMEAFRVAGIANPTPAPVHFPVDVIVQAGTEVAPAQPTERYPLPHER